MWAFLDVVLAIAVAGWLLDREPRPRPGDLRLVRGDAPEIEPDAEPLHGGRRPRRR